MKEEQNGPGFNAGDKSRHTFDEVHDDMVEYNATKKTVTDLLLYKKSLMNMDSQDIDKINEIKSKALEAINHLFNDIISAKKT